MNFWITIAKEVIGITGHKTIEKLATVPRDEGLKRIVGHEIVRRFRSPFDGSVEVVVIK